MSEKMENQDKPKLIVSSQRGYLMQDKNNIIS